MGIWGHRAPSLLKIYQEFFRARQVTPLIQVSGKGTLPEPGKRCSSIELWHKALE
jgi:hypothetical protein